MVKKMLLVIILIALTLHATKAYNSNGVECGADTWKTNWDACKNIGDGKCSIGETPQNSPSDCIKCVDDGYCSVKENYQNCPDECSKPSLKCGNNFCDPEENAVSCPQDCTCKKDYCKTRDAFLECPNECTDKNSIATQVVNGKVEYPFKQEYFTKNVQARENTQIKPDTQTFKNLILRYYNEANLRVEINLVRLDGTQNTLTSMMSDSGANYLTGKTSLPAGGFDGVTIKISRVSKPSTNTYEKIIIDWIGLYDDYDNEGWIENFETLTSVSTIKCYDGNLERDAGQEIKLINIPEDEGISKQAQLSFNTYTADNCIFEVTRNENLESISKNSQSITYDDKNGQLFIDNALGNTARYIDLTGITGAWKSIIEKMKITSAPFQQGKKFSLTINDATITFEDVIQDGYKYLSQNIDGQTKLFAYNDSEVTAYVQLKELLTPGKTNKITFNKINNYINTVTTLSNLEIYYGKLPKNIEPEKYVSLPMTWAFAIKGAANVGDASSCSLTNPLYTTGNKCELNSNDCSCTQQYMLEPLPEPVCRITRTSTPIKQDVTVTSYTYLDANNPASIQIDYSNLEGVSDYDWWINQFEIKIEDYPFDGKIVESNDIAITDDNIVKLMDTDDVYFTLHAATEKNCGDGIDNDKDGLKDCADPDCNNKQCDFNDPCDNYCYNNKCLYGGC